MRRPHIAVFSHSWNRRFLCRFPALAASLQQERERDGKLREPEHQIEVRKVDYGRAKEQDGFPHRVGQEQL